MPDTQAARVFRILSDGKPHSLGEIVLAANCGSAAATARIRDLRKARFGGHVIASRPVIGMRGVYEYRLMTVPMK